MTIPLLNDIVLILGLAVVVLFACHQLKIPVLVGFLVTGILVGPYGLGLVDAVHEVEVLAEVGVVLLLFTIGMEFSLERLLSIRKSVLLGGPLQVGLTILAVTVTARALGLPAGQALFSGFLVALSSTAIVLRLFQRRAEVDSPHGRTALGILILQDIVIVPMILVTPFLAGTTPLTAKPLLALLAKGGGIILLVAVSARWLIPRLLHQVVRTRDHELFLLSVVVLCFGIAWLTAQAGLSLALGAFLAGLIISGSEYSHQALGKIMPFRDVFTAFFFVSIGMMLDVHFLFRQPLLALALAGAVLVGKSLIAGLVTLLLGHPLRTAILTGFSLGQIGEFSFILSRAGLEHRLLAGDAYQLFLAVAILTMAATPFLLPLADLLAERLPRLSLFRMSRSSAKPVSDDTATIKDHLLIIGFGINGRNLAQAARAVGIPYLIIDTNPETVRQERARGEPIQYGDATQEPVLHRANVQAARIAVIAINDPAATRRMTAIIRQAAPTIHLIVRTRYLQEMDSLARLGASEVIPEEFETSVEIFTRVLSRYLVPRDTIARIVAQVRADGYRMLRSLSRPAASLADLHLSLHEVDISAFRVAQHSPLVGKTLARLALRKQYGITVVAIRREDALLANPGADTVIQPGDQLFFLGPPENIIKAAQALSSAGRQGDS